MSTPVTLKRDCHALVIPSGETYVLPAGTPVVVTQSLGGSFTVQSPAIGGLFRIADRDADALGLSPEAAPSPKKVTAAGPASEEAVWDQLKTCYDPEIPVNIVDLGLVYDVQVDGALCNVTMTLTSQMCPEAKTIPDVVKRRCNTVPGIQSTEVKVVWEPQWTPQRISAEGRKMLGIDEEQES